MPTKKSHDTVNNKTVLSLNDGNWIFAHESNLREQAIETLKRAKELEKIKQAKKNQK